MVYGSTPEQTDELKQCLQQQTVESEVVLDNPLALQHIPQSMNMLLTQHRPKLKVSHTKRVWLIAAVVAVVSFMFYVGLQLAEVYRYHRASNHLTQQLTQLYQGVFPGKALPGDPKSVLQPVLHQATVGGNDVFSGVMRKIGGVLAKNTGLQLTALNYNDKKADLTVFASSVATLNTFINQLSHSGLKVLSNQISASGKNQILTVTVRER